jgi:cytochrome c-type biogenesis protein
MTAPPEVLARLGFAATLGGFTFLAPCAFPLLPGYVAFFVGTTGEEERPRNLGRRLYRPATVGLLVSAGFVAVFLALGAAVWLLGASALADVSLLEPVVGSLLVVLGATMAAGRTPRLHVRLPGRQRSAGSFFLFGVVYAAAAAGCTAPLFVAVVTAGLAVGPALGAATLLAYAGGMSAMMLGVTALAAAGRDQVLSRLSASTGRVQRVAGGLLVVAGVTQVGYWLFWLGGRAELAALAG